MIARRLVLLVPAALLPAVISFTWTVDALAPKTAVWLLTGAWLVLLPGAAAAPAPLAALLGLAAFGCLRAVPSLLPIAPWLVGALLLTRARALAARAEDRHRYLVFTTGIAALVALNGVAQAGWNALGTRFTLVNPFGARILSTLGNPTFLADYLALHLPIALELARCASGAVAGLWWGCAGLSALALVLSGSKGGQLAALVAAAAWIVSVIRRPESSGSRVAVAAVAFAGFGAATVLAIPALRAPLERWTSAAERFSFSQRLDMLRGAGRLVVTAPVLGHGTGALPILFPTVQPATLTRSLGVTLSVNHAHNDWAEVAADLGLPGLILLIALVAPAWRRWETGGDEGALALSLVAVGVSMATNFFIYLPSSAFFLWVHLGLLRPPGAEAWSIPLVPRPRRVALLAAAWLCLAAGRLMLSTAHFHWGAEAVDRGDGITSVARLRKAVTLEPVNRHPWQYLGRAWEIRGDWSASLDAYGRARALAPWHAITNLNVGRVERQRYLALRLLRHDARDRAMEALLRALAANPWLTDPRIWGGDLAVDAGRMDLAQRFLGDAPPDIPPSVAWHRARVRWLTRLGNHRAAGLERGRADALEGREVLARGEAALQDGNLDEAERVARDVTRRWPALPAGWEVLGYVLHTRGRAAEARAAFMRLAAVQPDSVTAQINLGTIALNARRTEDAEKYLGRAVALAPALPEAHLGLARLRLMQGRRDEAAAEYRRTLELAPAHPQAAAELARLEGR